MKYYTFHINDSGAIEEIYEKKKDGENIMICKMYDDVSFNKLNDILHSTTEYILNLKTLDIFKEFKIISYRLRIAKVLRKERRFRFFKKNNQYNYYELTFSEKDNEECYEWIDFEKSEVLAINSLRKKIKINSHQHKLDLIEKNNLYSEKLRELENSKLSNKLKKMELDKFITYSFESKKIVFGKNFDSEIDLFKIPHYSWGVYVSERFRNKLLKENITDIKFTEKKEEINEIWKQGYPIIKFS